MRRYLPVLLLYFFTGSIHAVPPTPIQIKVVVVAMYEAGEDTGDAPGEYQFWVEREHLDHVLPFDAGFHHLRMNDQGVLAVLTGVGTAKAAASVMALGLDPRFDLSHAYWIVAGIAGGDPADVSLGSAVWVHWIIDGDLGYEIDAREIPPGWSTGYVPLRRSVPYEEPPTPPDGQMYELNSSLVDWAYNLTSKISLPDTDVMREKRSHFPEPAAQRPPFVAKGDDVSASTFWHGRLMDEWANSWVRYYTGGKGNFAVSAMEDTGILQSLTFLSHAGKIDLKRVLVLRTVSNYDQPPSGMTAAESLAQQKVGKYGAYLPALETAYAVGSPVVDAIVTHWDLYRDHPPYEQNVNPAQVASPASK
ncbi:MAG: purine nucleoside permease [Silvibacterium sp.]|nr:purine nucleoside permease [Silvibacterium sp.]